MTVVNTKIAGAGTLVADADQNLRFTMRPEVTKDKATGVKTYSDVGAPAELQTTREDVMKSANTLQAKVKGDKGFRQANVELGEQVNKKKAMFGADGKRLNNFRPDEVAEVEGKIAEARKAVVAARKKAIDSFPKEKEALSKARTAHATVIGNTLERQIDAAKKLSADANALPAESVKLDTLATKLETQVKKMAGFGDKARASVSSPGFWTKTKITVAAGAALGTAAFMYMRSGKKDQPVSHVDMEMQRRMATQADQAQGASVA